MDPETWFVFQIFKKNACLMKINCQITWASCPWCVISNGRNQQCVRQGRRVTTIAFFFNLDIILDLLWTHLSQCIIHPLTSIWKKYRNESCIDVSEVKYYLRTKNLIMICIVSVTTSLINCWTFGKRGMEIWKRINNVTLSVISSFVFCISGYVSDSFFFFFLFL